MNLEQLANESFDQRLRQLENILKYYDQLVAARDTLDSQLLNKTTDLRQITSLLNSEKKLLSEESGLSNSLNLSNHTLEVKVANKKSANSVLFSEIVELKGQNLEAVKRLDNQLCENKKREINEFKERIKSHENKFNDFTLKQLESDETVCQVNCLIKVLENKLKSMEDLCISETLKCRSTDELKQLLVSLKEEAFILNCSIDEFKTEIENERVPLANRMETNSELDQHQFEAKKAQLLQKIDERKRILQKKAELDANIARLEKKLLLMKKDFN